MSSIQDRPPAENSTDQQKTRAAPEAGMNALRTPLRFLKGVGPKRAAQLESLGLTTVEDLLYHLPFRYEDRREIRKISQATVGKEESFIGELVLLEKKYIPSRRRQMLLGRLADESGYLELVWYHVPPYLLRGLSKGRRLLVHGKVERGWGAPKRVVHPRCEAVDSEDGENGKILPIYLRPGGIPLSTMRRWVASAVAEYGRFLPRYLPEAVMARQRLMDLRDAMEAVHGPDAGADCPLLNRFASPAHRSIIFDEFFYLQLGLGLRKKQRGSIGGISFSREGDLTRRMRALLPFSLTAAQERVTEEIYRDMESPRPMQRLIQGDVGSGKTMVGWLAAVRAIESGFQAVWMAPTELLAEQHFRGLKHFADALGIAAVLLTGSLPEKIKREAVQRIEEGEVAFVVGTHAVIQEGVRARRLGLGIIDEQHRFGVAQRMALQQIAGSRAPPATPSAAPPDMLLMSATPIPRSLAMVLYGDMELSIVDEMPPGRIPVATEIVGENGRARLYERIREELRKGRQAYVVYPLVEASESLPLRDATGMAEDLSQGAFREFRLGLIHGRMSGAERDDAMRRFKEGELQILVATTVIEVGIDVPNATVMVVEHAERFGLSQLHQLRGRVGRGTGRSRCYLVHYGSGSADATARLRIMEREHDGFKIAEADLALRGPGELLGTRQSGLADFRLASLARDSRLLLEARKEALDWLASDPSLDRPESRSLMEILRHRWGGRLELGAIG